MHVVEQFRLVVSIQRREQPLADYNQDRTRTIGKSVDDTTASIGYSRSLVPSNVWSTILFAESSLPQIQC